MGKVINTMERTSKAVFESMNACGEKVTIGLSHVEYIKEDKLAISGTPGTLIHFTSGREVFVEEKYDSVRDMLNAFRMGINTGIRE